MRSRSGSPARAIGLLLAALAVPWLPVRGAAPATAVEQAWTFDHVPAGTTPPNFEMVGSPQRPDGRWVVVQDGRNRVLAQLEEQTGAHRLLVERTATFADVAVSVRYRGLSGDRAAGVVWRYGEGGDHYLARLNLAQQRASLYKVVRGTRSRIAGLDHLELDREAWHTVKVEHRGDLIRMWINGIPVAETRDRTVLAAGRIGVWTSSNSTAWFDDLHARPLTP